VRPGSKNVFAETHVDTARTAAELPLCLSALALSRLSVVFVSLMQPRHGIVIVINFHFYL